MDEKDKKITAETAQKTSEELKKAISSAKASEKRTAGTAKRNPSIRVSGPGRKGSLGSRLSIVADSHSDHPHHDVYTDRHQDAPHMDVPLPDKTSGGYELSDEIVKKLKGKSVIDIKKKLTKAQVVKLAALEVTVKDNYLIVPIENALYVKDLLGIKE